MPLDSTRIRAVLFDIDGTLSDTDDQMVSRVAQWLKPLGWLIGAQKLHPFARRLVMGFISPANFLYALLDGLGLDRFIMGGYSRKPKKKDQSHHFWIIPGVSDMLAKLHTRYILGVVSARNEETTLAFLHQFKLEGYFAVVVTSQTCRRTKPHPEPVQFAAQRLKVKPKQCLMVGDTTVDMLAGKRAGVQTVGVLCGFGTRCELLKSGADVIINTTAEIIQLL
jgi:HAD superfamily hydrolase (TIGR01549 family)